MSSKDDVSDEGFSVEKFYGDDGSVDGVSVILLKVILLTAHSMSAGLPDGVVRYQLGKYLHP